MKNASQFGEIAWILGNLKLQNVGTFVEVGASDGLENSNTFELEARGWRGLLIEPDPRSVEKVRRNRPLAIIEECAVSTVEHDEGVFFQHREPTWSGLRENTTSVARAIVKLRRLDTLLHAHKIDHVDLLSIDTEGTELDVWASRGACNPDIVLIEFLTEGLTGNSGPITKQMERDGYRLVYTTEVNHVFVRASE